MDYQDYVPQRRIIMKQWARKTIAGSGLKQSYLAHQMGMSEGRLSQFLDLDSDHPGLNACNLPILLKETSDLTILNQFERLFGRLAFKVPVNGETDQRLLVGQVFHDVGELTLAMERGDGARAL